jgi:hypothetical protein
MTVRTLNRTETLRQANFLASLAPGVADAVKVAKSAQRVRAADLEQRMAAKIREWRASQPKAFQETFSDRDLQLKLAATVTQELLAESRARVNAAKQSARERRADYDEARREWQRIPQPVPPATADETQRLLHTIVGQNARMEARTRVAHITDGPALFEALQRFESAGDTWAAIEAEAALERTLEAGPAPGSDLSAITRWRTLKDRDLPAYRETRIAPEDRARLDAVATGLDAAERELRGVVDLQNAMESVQRIEVVD